MRKNLIKYLIFVALQVVSYALASHLPVSAGWENGAIENLQVFVLVMGGVWAMKCWSSSDTSRMKAWWLTIASVWLVMVLRELSWGAVFLFPLALSAELGPTFSSSTQLWYKPGVVVALGGLMVIWLWSFIVTKQYITFRELTKRRTLPLAEISIVLVLYMVFVAAENHIDLPISLTGGAAQVYEESVELWVYICLLLAQYRIVQGLRR